MKWHSNRASLIPSSLNSIIPLLFSDIYGDFRWRLPSISNGSHSSVCQALISSYLLRLLGLCLTEEWKVKSLSFPVSTKVRLIQSILVSHGSQALMGQDFPMLMATLKGGPAAQSKALALKPPAIRPEAYAIP